MVQSIVTESSLHLQLETHDERRTSARSSPASANSGRREVLLGGLHELQQRSKQLVQPESAELPDMHWEMVRLGSLRAVSLASFAACGRRKFNAGAPCVCVRSRMGSSWRCTVSCPSACKGN